jgi:chromosome segregation ATPase
MRDPSATGADRRMTGRPEEQEGEVLAERVETLAAWIREIEAQVRAVAASGDATTLKELTHALEAWSKHDPKLEERLTNRVDVLADRLKTLAGTVNATALSLAGKDGEIAALRRELERGNTRIEALVKDLRQSGSTADIAELRRAVAALSADRNSRAADKRADFLPGKLDVLSERIDTLAATVATTAAGLAGREGDLAALRRQLEQGSSNIDHVVDEVGLRLGGLFAERLDSLRAAVVATTKGLSEREHEIATLRRGLENGTARVDSVVGELRRSLAALAEQVATLERSETPEAVRALGHRVDDLSGSIDSVAERLEAIATSVEGTSARLADKELELAGVHRRLDEASQHADTVVGELRDALAALPERGSVDPAVEGRLEALGQTLDSLTGHLSELEASTSARWQADVAASSELGRLIGDVTERLTNVERDRDAAGADLARASEAWTGESAWLRTQLDSLANTVQEAQEPYGQLEPRLGELAARVDAVEYGRQTIDAELARVEAAWERERDALRAELDSLSSSLTATNTTEEVPATNMETERALAELADRLDAVERDGAVVASEIARTGAFWASEHGSIEERLESIAIAAEAARSPDVEAERRVAELAGRLDAMERDRGDAAREIERAAETWAQERSSLVARLDELTVRLGETESAARTMDFGSQNDEVAQLRVLMDGLRMRVATSEKELAALAGARDVASRLDQLTWRLDSLETAAPWIAPSSPPVPVHGDGRFRMELRGLELRMEHAEAAARENREAVLMQLERLASRIEWRLQHLEENEAAGTRARAAGGSHGNVVPIRGDA